MRPLLLAALLGACGGEGVPEPPRDAARAPEDLAAADTHPVPEDRPTPPMDAADVLDAVALEDRAEVAADVGHPADDRPDAGPCAVCSYPNARAECSPSGACSLVGCLAGFGDCDGRNANGCETNVNEAANCGACGNTCPAGVRCIDARCDTCASGQRWCRGRCIEVLNDPMNCGACGVRCAFGQSCAESRCVCSVGFGNCDGDASNGCEVRIDTAQSCGACGARCPGGTCSRYFDAGAQGYACVR